MSVYILPCPKLPPGYELTSMVRGNRRHYIVIRESDRECLVQGQENESMAIRRAVALIEGKPIDYYMAKEST